MKKSMMFVFTGIVLYAGALWAIGAVEKKAWIHAYNEKQFHFSYQIARQDDGWAVRWHLDNCQNKYAHVAYQVVVIDDQHKTSQIVRMEHTVPPGSIWISTNQPLVVKQEPEAVRFEHIMISFGKPVAPKLTEEEQQRKLRDPIR